MTTRLTSFSGPSLPNTLTYAWRLDGLLAARGWGTAGDDVTFSYDQARRPIGMASDDASLILTQSYDRLGNVTSEGRTLVGLSGDAGNGAQTFSYDALRRLSGSSLNGNAIAYQYDLDANRTQSVVAGVTSDYLYDRDAALISQTIAASTTAFAYDAFGNMTTAASESGSQTLYTYDAADRLTSITPPGQSATSLTHDALGRIASRGAQTYSYVGTTNTAWRISDGSGATVSAIDAEGGRASVASGSDFGWLLPDLHGNLALARNQASTAIVSAMRYDGYGQDLASYAAGTLPTPWRYQGRLDVSPDTADPLYDAGARLYSPAIAIFTFSGDRWLPVRLFHRVVMLTTWQQAFYRYCHDRDELLPCSGPLGGRLRLRHRSRSNPH